MENVRKKNEIFAPMHRKFTSDNAFQLGFYSAAGPHLEFVFAKYWLPSCFVFLFFFRLFSLFSSPSLFGFIAALVIQIGLCCALDNFIAILSTCSSASFFISTRLLRFRVQFFFAHGVFFLKNYSRENFERKKNTTPFCSSRWVFYGPTPFSVPFLVVFLFFSSTRAISGENLRLGNDAL